MNLHSVFSTPIMTVDASQFLFFAKTLFDGRVEMNVGDGPVNLKTSLRNYEVKHGHSKIPESNDLNLFKEFVIEQTKNFLTLIGYDAEAYKYEVCNMWINESESINNDKFHAHNGYTVSGCYYVELPENSGGIKFAGPLTRIDKVVLKQKTPTIYNSAIMPVMPTEGTLLLWESYLPHCVISSTHDGKRRSIAFDVGITECL